MNLVDYFTKNSCKSLKIAFLRASGFYVIFLMLFICLFFLMAKFIAHVALSIKKLSNILKKVSN
ncbi:MAG: hypothetical protein DSZ03_04455 [Sulfurimonas sp.]|nr:MAG: hypothetical protein DSZ03_04455 [Sulfurimonas sp.]